MPWVFLLLALAAFAIAFKTSSLALAAACLLLALGLLVAWAMGLLAQRVGRETNHLGKLQELSGQGTRLAPDHADGSRGLRILEASDRH